VRVSRLLVGTQIDDRLRQIVYVDRVSIDK
jgi:hypothetical protein